MSKLVSPATGTITSNYGPRKSPGGIGSTNHRGVDIARGATRVAAPADGVVIVSRYGPIAGNYIQIDHGNGVRTRHHHLAKRHVAKGARVVAGQTIGTMGRTGAVTGVHLHTEVTINGVHVNPATWYANHGARLGMSTVGNLTAPKATPSGTGHVLQLGSSGTMVKALQSGLRRVFPAYRYAIPLYRRRLIRVDGKFGSETEAWVREFQERTGITVDGKVGPQTTRELAKYGIHL
jgi:peptidoglycan hydrolase-like protein with peptidoglycan-binding domain